MTSSQEYFMIVAKSLNMTQSAKELFISPQSLSYHISQLEKLAKMERDIQAEI